MLKLKADIVTDTSLELLEAIDDLISLIEEFQAKTKIVNLFDFQKLPPEKVRVLLSVLKMAGFYPKEIFFGDTFLKVIGQDEREDLSSTEWLADIFTSCFMPHRSMLRKDLRDEFLGSMPLRPIRLTADGALLEEHTTHFLSKHTRKHTRDHDSLPSYPACVGVHRYCGGLMDRYHGHSAFLDALLCRKCGLRVCFPREAEGYGDLREHFRSELTCKSQRGGDMLASLFLTRDV